MNLKLNIIKIRFVNLQRLQSVFYVELVGNSK